MIDMIWALKNKNERADNDAATAVCVNTDREVVALHVTQNGEPDCANVPSVKFIWKQQLPKDVAITDLGNSAAFSCMCFDSKGVITPNGTDLCGGCSSIAKFKFKRGSAEDEAYVN